MLQDPRHEKFCQLMANRYGKDDKKDDKKVKKKTITQCGIEAGYPIKAASASASRLLKSVKIKKRINEIVEENAEKAGIKVADELQKLQDFFVGVMQNSDERMNNRLKAAELYGKTIGAFTEKREISAKVSAEIKNTNPFEGMTLDEIKGLAHAKPAD